MFIKVYILFVFWIYVFMNINKFLYFRIMLGWWNVLKVEKKGKGYCEILYLLL